jgi:hypothetical protein
MCRQSFIKVCLVAKVEKTKLKLGPFISLIRSDVPPEVKKVFLQIFSLGFTCRIGRGEEMAGIKFEIVIKRHIRPKTVKTVEDKRALLRSLDFTSNMVMRNVGGGTGWFVIQFQKVYPA